MNPELIPLQSQLETNTIFLNDLIDVLVNSLHPAAKRNKSLVVNDVPENIIIDSNEHLLASVLGTLMKEVITHTENGCIRITAKLFGNIVLLHVKNDGLLNYDSISQNLSGIQSQVETLGGFIGFTSYRNKLTTIAFSFTNIQKAA
jgi:hypothetical protein